MSAYAPLRYSYSSVAAVNGRGLGAGTGPSSAGCGCETGRVVATDPVTGAAICSCQYDASPSRLSVSTYLNVNAYPRLAVPAPGSALHYSAAYAGGDPQSAYPSMGVDPAYFGSLGSSYYGVKDSTTADMGVYGGISTAAGYGYNPYDPSLYGYSTMPYDLAARRKNATREATSTLKAWLNEHKKNPYPTKGEKIMLAIITKMTLTQISTWFANARRRLKKDNKMTWDPKNRMDSDDDVDVASEAKDDETTGSLTDLITDSTSSPPKDREYNTRNLGGPGDALETPLKSKIWSLADTAECKTPPEGVAWSKWTAAGGGDSDGTAVPLPATIGPGPLARFSRNSPAQSSQQSNNRPQQREQAMPEASPAPCQTASASRLQENGSFSSISRLRGSGLGTTLPETAAMLTAKVLATPTTNHGYSHGYQGAHPLQEHRENLHSPQDGYPRHQQTSYVMMRSGPCQPETTVIHSTAELRQQALSTDGNSHALLSSTS